MTELERRSRSFVVTFDRPVHFRITEHGRKAPTYSDRIEDPDCQIAAFTVGQAVIAARANHPGAQVLGVREP
jgi:hypothetical protein